MGSVVKLAQWVDSSVCANNFSQGRLLGQGGELLKSDEPPKKSYHPYCSVLGFNRRVVLRLL